MLCLCYAVQCGLGTFVQVPWWLSIQCHPSSLLQDLSQSFINSERQLLKNSNPYQVPRNGPLKEPQRPGIVGNIHYPFSTADISTSSLKDCHRNSQISTSQDWCFFGFPRLHSYQCACRPRVPLPETRNLLRMWPEISQWLHFQTGKLVVCYLAHLTNNSFNCLSVLLKKPRAKDFAPLIEVAGYQRAITIRIMNYEFFHCLRLGSSYPSVLAR